ncbi:MAG TPA: class I SAM-dependent methyltransferase [Candidatus Eisenbacteria bacterium]|nr:class I SAM-dependent methyltransferase [Candidatus Eisenbacteria bacterium]
MTRPPVEAIALELTSRAEAHPDDSLLQFGSLLSAHQYLPLYRLFRNYVPERACVLDWGTGNGHFSYYLQRSGYRASGYSLLDGSFLRWLPDREFGFIRGDAREPVLLPYADGCFDAVASVGVLEHVRETGGNEAGSLAEIARVLRPGGVFACYHFPNRSSWIDWAARRVPGKHHHEFRFTRSDIESLTAGAGLRLMEAGRYGLLPRNFGHRLPGALRRSRALAEAWDRLDSLLAVPLSIFCQNYYFVTLKADPATSSGGRIERNAEKRSTS